MYTTQVSADAASSCTPKNSPFATQHFEPQLLELLVFTLFLFVSLICESLLLKIFIPPQFSTNFLSREQFLNLYFLFLSSLLCLSFLRGLFRLPLQTQLTVDSYVGQFRSGVSPRFSLHLAPHLLQKSRCNAVCSYLYISIRGCSLLIVIGDMNIANKAYYVGKDLVLFFHIKGAVTLCCTHAPDFHTPCFPFYFFFDFSVTK